MLRVFRDAIYYAQVLIWLAAFVWALFGRVSTRERIAYAAASGFFLGWLWLTREEGPWLIPGIVVLVGMAIFSARRSRSLRQLFGVLVVAFGLFAGLNVTFRATNWLVYGAFVGVDFKEANYQRALKEIHSVRSGGVLPLVSLTRAGRQQVYAVSPAFASLKDYFEGFPGRGWAKHSCETIPTPCDEIGAGYFIWVLREAAAEKGYYTSPGAASRFFGQIATEIGDACKRGLLRCWHQPIAEFPPLRLKQFTHVPLAAWNIASLVFARSSLDAHVVPGDTILYARDMAFLNFPLHTGKESRPLAGMQRTIVIYGWYHRSGSEWFSAIAKTKEGTDRGIHINRRPSRDIASRLADPAATMQRYALHFDCDEACVLNVITGGGARAEVRLDALREGRDGLIKIGDGEFFVERTEGLRATLPPGQRISRAVRGFVVSYYNAAFVPVILAGLLAFVAASVRHRRKVWSNCAYRVALASWVLVLSRAALLILMEVINGAGVNAVYFLPANFLLVVAAVSSIGAFVQLHRGEREGADGTPFPRARTPSMGLDRIRRDPGATRTQAG